MEEVGRFVLTAALIELTPGPNMGFLAALALARGRRAGLAAVAGVALGLAGLGAVATLATAALLGVAPALRQALRYAGTAYLLWLAWDTWRPAPAGTGVDEAASFRRGLVTNLLNPKAALFFTAVLPGFVPATAAAPRLAALGLVALYVAIATAVHAAIVLGADALRPWVEAGGRRERVRGAAALGLVLVAAWFFVSTRRG